jgi:hypothetical protein
MGNPELNNTEKLDDIRRRLRVMETRLAILQRVNVIMFERLTGGAFPRSWVVHDKEQNILTNAGALSDDEFWEHVATEYGRRP